ncbi:MAG TPA: FG-GAP-like repeat-containing protein, partial [Flavipsychrobacter sp.]
MALVLLMVTTVVSNAQTTLVDEMPYTYDVTSTGAFTYSLPIRIPPGIKDMMPELAITYNSQANNGLMGMGWSLSGLSSITRTPSTLYHHSELKSIDYSNADNFSLDGMPLYKDASTGYYMTWIKNYSKIQAYDPGTGIANWTVQSTDGLTYEYGNSSASLRYTGGKILAYALDKVTDKYGNYISFEYIQDVNKGTLQISKISYNANSTIPSLPTTEITFNYITKAVTNQAWVGSASFIDDILLSGIEVKHNGIVVNKYELTYALTASVYHLTKIEEIRGSYTVPPIVINWNNDPVIPAQETPFASANTGGANFAVLDYNGDGFADYTKSGISSTLELYTNTRDGLFSMQTITRSYAAVGGVIGSNYQMRVDMNGDGFEDLLTDVLIENGPTDWQRIIYYHESIGTTLSAGTAIFSYRNVAGGSGSAAAWASAMKVIPGDFDGDGKTELFVLVPASMGSAGPPPSMPNDFFSYIIDMSYNFHGETLPGSTVGAIYGNYLYAGKVTGMINALVPMDHDGNGKDDIVIVYNATGTATYIYNVNFAYTGSGNTVAMSTGTAPTLSVITSSIYPTKDHAQWHVGDFNGDGKKDALIWKPVGASGRWDIVYSEANGLSLQAPSTNLQAGLMDGGEPNWPNTICVKVADFNGDGKDDILRLENTHGLGTLGPVSYKIFYATGYDYTTHRGTFTLESETDKFNNISAHGGSVEIGDFNGDGHVDLFSHYNGNSATTPGIAFFYKDDLRHTVNMIEHGVKKLNIGIDFLPQRQGNSHNFRRKAVTPATYPYISKVLPIKITNGVADNANIYNKAYVYEESIINVVGLGMMGFSRMSVIDHPSGLVRENVYSNLSDVENPIPFVKEWRDWTTMDWNNYYFNGVPIGFPNNSPSAMGGSTYNNNNGGCAGRVRMVTLNNSTDFQLHTGIYKTNTPSYSTTIGSIGYEYGQPDVVVSTNGPCTTTVNYTYNLSAPLHYVAKPVTCTTSTQRFSQPAYTRISNYQYNAQGQLSTLTGDPGTSNEKVVQYAYDGWGNLASDITTATGVAGAISHSYNATTDGRFVERSFNPQNVPSEFTYNIWGKVLTENGPSNNDDITYEYNAFNRLTKKTDVSTGIYTIYDFGLATGMADAVVPESKYYASTSTVGISGTNIEFYDMYMRKLRTVSTGYNGQKLYKDYVYQWGVLQFETNMYDPANSSTKVTTQYDYDKWYRHRKISTVPASQETYMSYVFYQTPIPRLETTIETVSGASKVVTTDESGAT